MPTSMSTSAPMRYLAIDLGDARTGLAVGDSILRISSPAGLLEVPIARLKGEELLIAILNAIKDHAPSALVIGLPLNMDGTEGGRSKIVRAFAARIAERTKLPLHFHDERLSTVRADWQMARSGM